MALGANELHIYIAIHARLAILSTWNNSAATTVVPAVYVCIDTPGTLLHAITKYGRIRATCGYSTHSIAT